MTGRLIFLTMTALPEREAATSLVLNALFSKTRRIASATAAPSMIAPSTMLSGGTGSLAKATTLKFLPEAFSSTALTALEPMSRPTTDLDFPSPNTSYVLTEPAECCLLYTSDAADERSSVDLGGRRIIKK